MADLAQNFARAETLPGDSRETVRLCVEWAEAFEEKHKARVWDGEYLDEIDTWFQSHYADWLNHASDTVPND